MSRLTLFLPSLAGGGAERVTLTLARSFVEQGHSVDLVLASAVGPLLEQVPPGVTVVDLAARRLLASVLPLARYLRRARPDALIAAPDIVDLVAIWAKLLAMSQTRVVITAHSNLSASPTDRFPLRWKAVSTLLRIFHPVAHAVVAVSGGAADELASTAHIPRRRISAIPNPVELEEVRSLQAEPPDNAWFEPGQPPVVLAAGRLNVAKDYPLLMRAFAELRRRRPARLLILGEGEIRPRLEELRRSLDCAADIALPGFDVNPYRYMARCGVFVLSSAWEGFALVLAEALACGAQVVATDCASGPAEILEGGRYGRLVPVGDEDALAVAMEAALDDPLPAAMLRARAQAFSPEKAAAAYLRAAGLA